VKPNHNGGQRREALFPLGQLVATPGAIEAMQPYENITRRLVGRHVTGDWGDLCAEDKASNDRALLDGSRVFSAYLLPDGETKIWVITEADRSATTLLLPSEY
jgi:hypothetical protein